MTSKFSFAIRPPTSSRSSELQTTHIVHSRSSYESRSQSFTPHPNDSSDEEEDQDGAVQHIVGFDSSGAQRAQDTPKLPGPLVIPALANRDWRAVARSRGKPSFIPQGSDLSTGRDGSQGGLGTRDTINSAPQAAGLIRREQQKTAIQVDDVANSEEVSVETNLEQRDESEDERARRALLASVSGDAGEGSSAAIDFIPLSVDNVKHPMDETEAYKLDVVTRPDSSTLQDYERVPVSQFGAALLRGMGWKEGTAASRTRTGLVEPWLPSSRPALLGLGAKERPADEIPAAVGKQPHKSQRPERRYVPIVRVQREESKALLSSRSRSTSPRRSTGPSRLPSSGSASPYPNNNQDPDRQRRDHGDRVGGGDRYNGQSRHSRSERESGRHRVEHYDIERDRDRDRGGRDRRQYEQRERTSHRDRESGQSDRDRSSRGSKY